MSFLNKVATLVKQLRNSPDSGAVKIVTKLKTAMEDSLELSIGPTMLALRTLSLVYAAVIVASYFEVDWFASFGFDHARLFVVSLLGFPVSVALLLVWFRSSFKPVFYPLTALFVLAVMLFNYLVFNDPTNQSNMGGYLFGYLLAGVPVVGLHIGVAWLCANKKALTHNKIG